MEQPPATLMIVGPWIRWTVWVAAVGALSAALLTSEPARVAGAALTPQTNFLASKTVHVLSYFTLALLTVPVVIASVESTSMVMSGQTDGVSAWLYLLGGFSIVYLTASYLVFEYVVEE